MQRGRTTRERRGGSRPACGVSGEWDKALTFLGAGGRLEPFKTWSLTPFGNDDTVQLTATPPFRRGYWRRVSPISAVRANVGLRRAGEVCSNAYASLSSVGSLHARPTKDRSDRQAAHESHRHGDVRITGDRRGRVNELAAARVAVHEIDQPRRPRVGATMASSLYFATVASMPCAPISRRFLANSSRYVLSVSGPFFCAC